MLAAESNGALLLPALCDTEGTELGALLLDGPLAKAAAREGELSLERALARICG